MDEITWLEISVNTAPEKLDEVCARLAAAGGSQAVVLAHLSQENNTPERARAAAAQALESLGRPVHLSVAPEQERGPLFRLENGTVSVVEEIALC